MCIHRKTLLIKINTKLIAKKEQVVEWVKIKDKFASCRRLDRKIWGEEDKKYTCICLFRHECMMLLKRTFHFFEFIHFLSTTF